MKIYQEFSLKSKGKALRIPLFVAPYLPALGALAFVASGTGDLSLAQSLIAGGTYGVAFSLVNLNDAGSKFAAGVLGEKVLESTSRVGPILSGAVGFAGTLIAGYNMGLVAPAVAAAAAVGGAIWAGAQRGQTVREDEVVRTTKGELVTQTSAGFVYAYRASEEPTPHAALTATPQTRSRPYPPVGPALRLEDSTLVPDVDPPTVEVPDIRAPETDDGPRF